MRILAADRSASRVRGRSTENILGANRGLRRGVGACQCSFAQRRLSYGGSGHSADAGHGDKAARRSRMAHAAHQGRDFKAASAFFEKRSTD